MCNSATVELTHLRLSTTNSLTKISDELKISYVLGFLQHFNNINNFKNVPIIRRPGEHSRYGDLLSDGRFGVRTPVGLRDFL
jgi:hypothetical protein